MRSLSRRRWSESRRVRQGLGDESGTRACAVERCTAAGAGRCDALAHVRIEVLGTMELAPRRHDIRPGFEQPAQHVDVGPVTHVEHAVRSEGEDLLDVLGRYDPGRPDPTQRSGVLARFGVGVDVEAHQLQLGMLDRGSERARPDVARGPLDHPIGTSTHARPSLLGCLVEPWRRYWMAQLKGHPARHDTRGQICSLLYNKRESSIGSRRNLPNRSVSPGQLPCQATADTSELPYVPGLSRRACFATGWLGGTWHAAPTQAKARAVGATA